MRTTGIVRRIDDFGRVVIPKDIRNRLAINTGDPLELFLDGDSVVYRKYFPCGDYVKIAKNAIEEIVVNAELDYGIDPKLKDAAVKKMQEAVEILERMENVI